MRTLVFSRSHSYNPSLRGIVVPVHLENGGSRVGIKAIVDTGASHCVFERAYAEVLGLDVEAGEPITFRSAGGGVDAFGHWVALEAMGMRFESLVYFFADHGISRNLLGRVGWLDRIRLGIVDHDGVLLAAEYDE